MPDSDDDSITNVYYYLLRIPPLSSSSSSLDAQRSRFQHYLYIKSKLEHDHFF